MTLNDLERQNIGSVGVEFDWQSMAYSWNSFTYRRKNFPDVFYTSWFIPHFVPHFIAMATRECLG